MLIVTAVLAGLITGFNEHANADGGIPTLNAIILNGNVSISGGGDPNGMLITARVGDWTSEPAVVGEFKDKAYAHLLIYAPPELIGSEVIFYLDDQILADEKTVYAKINSTGKPDLTWALPLLRQVNLLFPSAPIATPTVTPIPASPTATPVILAPTFYEGRVRAGSVPPPNGTLIHAVIDGYVTQFASVFDGEYFLTFDPIDGIYDGRPVEFYIGETKALQSDIFEDGIRKENFLLAFPPLPTPTPVPTETPTPTPTLTPTPTPEPTRTPTPTPTPTVVPSATPTPTPIADTTATAEAEATAEAIVRAEEGGSCSAREGGPAGLGNVALLLAPLALLAWRRMERNAR